MTRLHPAAASIALIIFACSAAARAEPRIVGYYPSWGLERDKYAVSEIPGELLTHINYAFAKVAPTGELVLGNRSQDTHRQFDGPPITIGDRAIHGNIGELLRLKQRFPHLKIILSVGGWDWSRGFSSMAATQRGRTRFAESCVNMMRDYGFDGVDIDWEFPVSGGQFPNSGSPDDAANLMILLRSIRAALDALGNATSRVYELTIAVPAGQENLQYFDLAKLHPSVDCIYLMTYDLWGSWADRTAFHAPLSPSPTSTPYSKGRNVEDVVKKAEAAGVPRQKLIVGVPFYGRGVIGVPPKSRGLDQPFRGPASGTWDDELFSYRDLTQNYFPKYSCNWNHDAKASWLYAADRNGLMISFEDQRSAALKADYVRDQALGGIMVWDLTMDTKGESSLLRTIASRLRERTMTTQEELDHE